MDTGLLPRHDLLKRPSEANVHSDHGDETNEKSADEPKYLGGCPGPWPPSSSTAEERHAAQYPPESPRKPRNLQTGYVGRAS
jgi:hypothetical protein